MSNRERWIIYPLLFMALLFGLKQGLVPKPTLLEAPTLICKELQIVDSMDPSSRKVRVQLNQGRNGAGQVGLFNGENEQTVLLSTTGDASGGAVVIFGQNEKMVGALATHETGGYLELNASDSDRSIRFAFPGESQESDESNGAPEPLDISPSDLDLSEPDASDDVSRDE